MTRFECVGPACEDTCCANWTVHVDEPHYRALEAVLPAARFRRAVLPLAREEATSERFATMAMEPDQRCTFHGDDRLCTLHRSHGEEMLPTTCAIFPRSIGRLGDRAELAGALSCPEVARLCLLAEDAVDLVPLEPARFVRPVFHRVLAVDATDPYDRTFARVRDAAVRLLTRPYPIDSRLYFLAHLADQTARYLRRGAAFDDAHLDRTLAALDDVATLDALDRACSSVEVDEPWALGVVSQILLARRAHPPRSFAALTDAVLAGYPALTGDSAVDAPAMWDEHRRRQAALPTALHARVELYVRNFCINQLLKSWYPTSPSFLGYLQVMLVHVAVARFLLGRADPPASREELDARAVDVFYKIGRALLQDDVLTERIVAALERLGMQTLRHSALLIMT